MKILKTNPNKILNIIAIILPIITFFLVAIGAIIFDLEILSISLFIILVQIILTIVSIITKNIKKYASSNLIANISILAVLISTLPFVMIFLPDNIFSNWGRMEIAFVIYGTCIITGIIDIISLIICFFVDLIRGKKNYE